jgi:D-lactate dehydrogenase (cytochrome)
VPISRLADCILETRREVEAEGLLAPLVGHVGDGNFHLTFLIDPDDPAEAARADDVTGRMIERALAMGGTCTGEHGIGSGKIRYLEAEHGDALPLMRRIKLALDPKGILNPGKILRPSTAEAGPGLQGQGGSGPG